MRLHCIDTPETGQPFTRVLASLEPRRSVPDSVFAPRQTFDEMHLGYVEYFVPGVAAGVPLPGLRRGRGFRRLQ